MKSPANAVLSLSLVALLASCGGGDGGQRVAAALPQAPTNGPAADYPMVIGDPFTIDGVNYQPSDSLNYDAVGYAAIAPEGGTRISGSHKTLPVPSYAEVTALDSGKTILVRIEGRGPMTNSRLIALSPGALAQLGLTGQASGAVRVRRVNPPEPERSALRSGLRAPDRMETPESLLTVLRRRLETNANAPLTGAPRIGPAPVPTVVPSPRATPAPRATPTARPVALPSPRATVSPAPRPTPSPAATAAASGGMVVQVAAFSARARADAAAARVGGSVSQAGQIWRVRMGPFSTQTQAQAALARARGAGYSDARILRAD
jgi:rare lipoprotein A